MTLAETLEPRVQRLISIFNGAIKYLPMLMDHGEHVSDPRQHWTDDECIAFAKHWHAIAEERFRSGKDGWNNGIPYCRNVWKDSNA